ncbi:MAG: hypothetical protein WAW17_07165 [Rhodococcus sp. (in: high G+C Gram-positive bacteria)]|uniref:hypothetical protein n=1 Tax=Rhodococcus sp. TaxID=1831 RepID=UPI003BAF2F9A
MAEFKRPSGSAYERVGLFRKMARTILPNDVTTRIRLSGSFTDSVDSILRDHDVAVEAAYTTERGANVAVARTIAAPDGTFDIVLDAGNLLDAEANSQADRRHRTRSIRHTAAHEPQHVLLHLARTDGEYYREDIICARTPRAYRKNLAEALDEYRCELAANRIAPSATSRESVFVRDLSSMREAINGVRALVETDIDRALYVTMTAACQMFKALAYLAAEYVVAGREPEPPQPLSPGWDRYLQQLWPDVLRLLRGVPAADEPCTHDLLTSTLAALCVRFSQWMHEVGIRYENREDGQECYWDHQVY